MEGQTKKIRNTHNKPNGKSVFRTGISEKFILLPNLFQVALLRIQLSSKLPSIGHMIYVGYTIGKHIKVFA